MYDLNNSFSGPVLLFQETLISGQVVFVEKFLYADMYYYSFQETLPCRHVKVDLTDMLFYSKNLPTRHGDEGPYEKPP